jgi:hypothetical protein
MSLDAENVTQPGSGLVFANAYGAGVTDAYRAAIVSAEHVLQSHFTNSVTVEMQFDLTSLGGGFSAENTYALVGVSYHDYVAALASHATTAADLQAVAGLPQDDPSHGVGFWIASTEARVLGLSTEAKATDDTVMLNADKANEFGKDTISTLEHEISEGVFGRLGSLGVTLQGWQPMDLFRFNAEGQRDYTGGADGQATYFGIDGAHLSALEYHNAINPDGTGDGDSLGDWTTSSDTFGPGGPGVVGTLSATDLQILDILGWTPAAQPAAVAAPAPAPTIDAHDTAMITHAMSPFWNSWIES